MVYKIWEILSGSWCHSLCFYHLRLCHYMPKYNSPQHVRSVKLKHQKSERRLKVNKVTFSHSAVYQRAISEVGSRYLPIRKRFRTFSFALIADVIAPQRQEKLNLLILIHLLKFSLNKIVKVELPRHIIHLHLMHNNCYFIILVKTDKQLLLWGWYLVLDSFDGVERLVFGLEVVDGNR